MSMSSFNSSSESIKLCKAHPTHGYKFSVYISFLSQSYSHALFLFLTHRKENRIYNNSLNNVIYSFLACQNKLREHLSRKKK